jgi:hypothetical protein
MMPTLVKIAKGALCFGVIVACLAVAPAPAQGQIEVRISPPAWFIATAQPVYFEGHAAYWYGDRWYYRDRGAWRYYHDEPEHLRDYRGHHEGGRQFYGRAHGGGFRHR